MLGNQKRVAVALAAVAATALSVAGVAGVADAASKQKHSKRHATKKHSAASRGAGRETELTGATAQSARDAATAAVPGTAGRASTEDPSDASGAAYEVHVTKADGSEVEVLLDSSFKVIKTQASKHGRGHGHGGRDGGNRETELTGATAQSAKDAATAAVPGTAWRASTEDPSDASGAAYEVHVTKSDGSEVEVLLDSSFNVVKTQASKQHP
jgi:uncharacterized membrane protein YkoI